MTQKCSIWWLANAIKVNYYVTFCIIFDYFARLVTERLLICTSILSRYGIVIRDAPVPRFLPVPVPGRCQRNNPKSEIISMIVKAARSRKKWVWAVPPRKMLARKTGPGQKFGPEKSLFCPKKSSQTAQISQHQTGTKCVERLVLGCLPISQSFVHCPAFCVCIFIACKIQLCYVSQICFFCIIDELKKGWHHPPYMFFKSIFSPPPVTFG